MIDQPSNNDPQLLPADPRAGWAQASRDLAMSGEAGLEWPDFANIGDVELQW
ncbi:hypothetical protein WG78_15245 [Amantichitinum ursilacus]|uniref:Uncharacterized protein n=1 Tax=Amantichitinum ursilacus TaxID=857265 RepID=A0A0N0XJJ7_9NEIS|nr:hypothetical protein WG78_15245 [Amantichitinum ursilacus]